MSIIISCPHCRAKSIEVTINKHYPNSIEKLLEYTSKCPECLKPITEEDVYEASMEIYEEIFGQMLDSIYEKSKERSYNT